jgi:hypothetical protein
MIRYDPINLNLDLDFVRKSVMIMKLGSEGADIDLKETK